MHARAPLPHLHARGMALTCWRAQRTDNDKLKADFADVASENADFADKNEVLCGC